MSDLPDAAAVLRAVERRFRIYGPSVDAAMSVFVPVLEERDEEIERLNERFSDLVIELRDENDRILELIAENRRLRGLVEKEPAASL